MILDEYRPFVAREHEVRAILEGRQTQFRRAIKPQPPSVEAVIKESGCSTPYTWSNACTLDELRFYPIGSAWACRNVEPKSIVCPFGKPGDRLYVKEVIHGAFENKLPTNKPLGTDIASVGNWWYAADWDSSFPDPTIKLSSVSIPRWASRITLEVKRVWVERIQDISEQDAIACGVPPFDWNNGWSDRPIPEFKKLWDSMNKSPWQWDDNPWVWCVEFGMIQEP